MLFISDACYPVLVCQHVHNTRLIRPDVQILLITVHIQNQTEQPTKTYDAAQLCRTLTKAAVVENNEGIKG